MQATEAGRAEVHRLKKPLLARELLSGAILGALIWLAIRALGFHGVFHLSGAVGLGPSALIGAVLGASPWRATLWVVGGALVALFAIVAFTPLVVQPAQALVRSDPIPSPPLMLDAVVVLSGGVSTDGLLTPESTERLLAGLRLAKATGTEALVTTRVRNPGNAAVSSDADQKKLAALLGDGLQLFIVPDVFSTRDEALRVRELAARQQWARVAVVTSPAHSRRACGTFEKVGLRVTCVPAESREVAFRTLTSSGDRIAAFRLWIYELAGTIYYRSKSWLP